jgi:hypothetical protein
LEEPAGRYRANCLVGWVGAGCGGDEEVDVGRGVGVAADGIDVSWRIGVRPVGGPVEDVDGCGGAGETVLVVGILGMRISWCCAYMLQEAGHGFTSVVMTVVVEVIVFVMVVSAVAVFVIVAESVSVLVTVAWSVSVTSMVK